MPPIHTPTRISSVFLTLELRRRARMPRRSAVGAAVASAALMRRWASRARAARPERLVARHEGHHEVHGEGGQHERGGHDPVVLAARVARHDDRERDEPDAAHHRCRPAARRGLRGRRRAAPARAANAVPARVSSQAAGADQVAELGRPRDQHERGRREHQAHVEVAEEEHVSSAIRGAFRGTWPRARSGGGDGASASAGAGAAAARAGARRGAARQRAPRRAAAATRERRATARRARGGWRDAADDAGRSRGVGQPPGPEPGRRVRSSLESKSGMCVGPPYRRKSPRAVSRRSRRSVPQQSAAARAVYLVLDFVTTL